MFNKERKNICSLNDIRHFSARMKSTHRPNLYLREKTAEFLVQTRYRSVADHPAPARHYGIGLPDCEVRRCRAQENGERVTSSHPDQRIHFRRCREGLGSVWNYQLREVPHPGHEGQHPPLAASAGDVLSHQLMLALPIDGSILLFYKSRIHAILYSTIDLVFFEFLKRGFSPGLGYIITGVSQAPLLPAPRRLVWWGK